jgi:prefoldin subunit 5
MKKNINIFLSILLTLPLNAKIEILDRVAIIVGEGVVLESQVNKMLENIKKR